MRRADVTFESGGVRCAAWLYRPDGGPVPCVVLAHGFSAVRDQRLDAFAERFARAGLAALAFDYRHFGASEGAPRQLVDLAAQLADWRAAIAFARGLDGIDGARIALWGSSLSGGHAMAVAASDPSLAAVVAQAPFADGLISLPALGLAQTLRLAREGLRDQLRAARGLPPHVIPVVGPAGTLRVLSAPSAEPGFRAMTPPDTTWRNEVAARVALRLGLYRPARRAARIGCPMLVCVADRDDLTAPGLAIRAARRAPRGELVRYPVGHFDVFVGDGFERAVGDQTAFLTRHLLQGAAASDDQSRAVRSRP
ncbi:MAG TPA: alpha/beta fold hydrolase [Solirubrobacteraceae bacterium]|nr:alpha/beta fold hydrolase [Solirubrobacteraceae bacterium]